MNKIMYFDTETTGTNEVKHDIIQLACIVEIDGEVKEEKEFRMRPIDANFQVEQEALIAHGFTEEQIRNFPDPRVTYGEIISFLSKYVDRFNKLDKFSPCGYNVDFDIRFLRQFFMKMGDKYYGSWFNWNVIDPLQIVKYMVGCGWIKPERNNLETIVKYFNLPEFKAHDAMADIRATRELKLHFDKLIFREKIIQTTEIK